MTSKKTNLIRMMKETNIQSQVTSTIAGDDGEAVAKSEQNAKKKVLEKPNEGLEKPADAGWYVAVVRVNCETRIADSIRINLNHNHVWFDYWIVLTPFPSYNLLIINMRYLMLLTLYTDFSLPYFMCKFLYISQLLQEIRE